MTRGAAHGYPYYQRQIAKKFRRDAYQACLAYIQGQDPAWWGAQKEPWLSEFYLVATGMHDMMSLSYKDIEELLSKKKSVCQKTLQHNIKLCRGLCRQWAQASLRLGSRAEWNAAVRNARLPEWLKHVRFLDRLNRRHRSSDRKRTGGPKSNNWSGKAHKPARRFMALGDGNGVIRKIWFGYSPKRHDSSFVLEHRDFFEDNLKGIAILGDEHFSKAARQLRDPRIIATPRSNATIAKVRETGFATTQAELERHRADVQHFRARVELPFAAIKNIFKCLSKGASYPFMEDFDELDNVVMWAAGLHNFKKLHDAPEDQ
jgi:hypothetical protein